MTNMITTPFLSRMSSKIVYCFVVMTILFGSYVAPIASAAGHPYLASSDQISKLAAGGADWIELKNWCDNNLNKFISDGYAGWDWRTTIEKYALAYLVAKQIAPADAPKYGQKGLALTKTMARDFNLVFQSYQYIGVGNGTKTLFPLPMAPMSGATITVMKAPTVEIPVVYSSVTGQIILGGTAYFGPIIKISDVQGGAASYTPQDYYLGYKDQITNQTSILRWKTANHPAQGQTYYVTVVQNLVGSTTQFTLQGGSIDFVSPPAVGEAIFVKYLADNYAQTVNGLGGLNSVTPDSGYPSRTYIRAVAEAYDAFYDVPGFDVSLKQEFYELVNSWLDWYKKYGYECNGDIGNYFVQGFLQPVVDAGYGTQPENPRASEWQSFALSLATTTANALQNKIPSGYGVQGDYAAGTYKAILNAFTIINVQSGQNLLSGLAWTDNLISALIHGTKPGRSTFYDGGDWTTLPSASKLFATIAQEFINDLPAHPSVPFARQWLLDTGVAPPAGIVSDYKVSFPMSYCGQVSGPVYARTDWGNQATWLSFVASSCLADHQHRDQGHFTVQRGNDYLIQDGGGYGFNTSLPWHNTFGFDDRGAGNISTYPPGQGWWGKPTVSKFVDHSDWVYMQSDIADAYVKAYGGAGAPNSVKRALRSILFLRSTGMILVHDQVQVANDDVKQIFNLNFSGVPLLQGSIYSIVKGPSKLFMKPVVLPHNSTVALASSKSDYVTSTNYQVTSTGQKQDTFFHVFQTADSGVSDMSAAYPLTSLSELAQGIEVNDSGSKRVFLFATRDCPYVSGAVIYSPGLNGAHKDVISDLKPGGVYDVIVSESGTNVLATQLTASDKGMLVLDYTSSGPASVSIVPAGRPVINLSLSVDKSTPKVGDTVTCTLTMKNHGSAAGLNSTITSTIDPEQLVSGSISSGGVLNGTTIQWSVASIAPGASVSVTYSETFKEYHLSEASLVYKDISNSTYSTTSNRVLVGTSAGSVNNNEDIGPVMSSNMRPGELKVVGSLRQRGAVNPNNGDTAKIYFMGSAIGKYECRIYDLNRTLIWQNEKDNLNTGMFEWIPKNIPSGGYIVNVIGPGFKQIKKIAVLK